MVIEAEKSQLKVPADALPGEGQGPGSQSLISSLYPHVVEAGRELSGTCFIRALIPLMWAPSS